MLSKNSFLCRSPVFSESSLSNILCWWFGGGGTPVLIPNTAVKPACADGSRKARVGRRQHKIFEPRALALVRIKNTAYHGLFMAVCILVIQFRNDDAGIEAEKSALWRTIGEVSSLTFKNALRDEVAWNEAEMTLADFDGVILPGSAELYFDGGHNEEHEGRAIASKIAEAARPFVQHLIEKDIPTLGICFGHQLLAFASGAPVRYSKKEGKTGTMRIGIDAAGENDPLLAGLPKNFFGQYVHKDAVADLPPKATVLASNRDRCRYAALRYAPHVYSVQFHPERTREDCIESMQRAPEYLEDGADPNDIFKETPRSTTVLLNFVSIVESRLSHLGDLPSSGIGR